MVIANCVRCDPLSRHAHMRVPLPVQASASSIRAAAIRLTLRSKEKAVAPAPSTLRQAQSRPWAVHRFQPITIPASGLGCRPASARRSPSCALMTRKAEGDAGTLRRSRASTCEKTWSMRSSSGVSLTAGRARTAFGPIANDRSVSRPMQLPQAYRLDHDRFAGTCRVAPRSTAPPDPPSRQNPAAAAGARALRATTTGSAAGLSWPLPAARNRLRSRSGSTRRPHSAAAPCCSRRSSGNRPDKARSGRSAATMRAHDRPSRRAILGNPPPTSAADIAPALARRE
jgi:hypothetical protein